MSLGVVLDELQVMAAADIPYPIRIGTATIEMDNHNGLRTRGNCLFYERIVDL